MNPSIRSIRLTPITLVLFLFVSFPAGAQDHGGDPGAQANNPLANMTAFNLQDYYIGEITESSESG